VKPKNKKTTIALAIGLQAYDSAAVSRHMTSASSRLSV
jgi:hypothetical protein